MAESNAGFEPKPDYDYNTEDKIRRSHDVRVWDDGEIWLISQDGLTSIEPPHDEVPKDDSGAYLKYADHAYVDIRRTDLMRHKRGRGRHYIKSWYHFKWLDKGREHPDARQIVWKTITSPNPESTSSEVRIPLIKSLVMTTTTFDRLPYRRKRRSQFIGKRVFFNNDAHDGRRVKIKTVRGGVEVEIVKTMMLRVSRGAYYRQSRFHSLIWADPKKRPNLYDEGTKKGMPTE